MLLPPDITSSPKHQTNAVGSTASFTVAATSLQPLVYQWQKDGVNLTDTEKFFGTDTTNLIVNSVSASDAGVYSVVVVNANFSVTNYANLVVFLPPQSFYAGISNGNQLALQFTGTPNYSYILQSATNLTPPINWKPVFTNPADANGTRQFTDTNLNGDQKFYRAVGQ